MKTINLLASLALVLGCTAASQATPFDIETKITAADAAANDVFGVSVAISGNTALVGAPGDDDGGSSSGSAYLYENTIPEPSSLLLSTLAIAGLLTSRIYLTRRVSEG